jgi:hypothetical protein
MPTSRSSTRELLAVCEFGQVHEVHLCCCARLQAEERIHESNLWLMIAVLAMLAIPISVVVGGNDWVIPLLTMLVGGMLAMLGLILGVGRRLQAWSALARLEAARELPLARVVR